MTVRRGLMCLPLCVLLASYSLSLHSYLSHGCSLFTKPKNYLL